MRIIMIRHGMTAGNQRRAYIGSTDEPLCEEGMDEVRKKAASVPPCSLLLVSPMLRCRQTASLLYPGMDQQIEPDFRECDFGVFEGKNAEELTGDPAFQGWIETNGRGTFPDGEDPAAFMDRVCAAFAARMGRIPATETVTLAVHGGVIMAILSRYALPERLFYEWGVPNAEGYSADWDGAHLTGVERI